MSKQLVIAIDGPGGAGKSTVSRTLAKLLGYRYVDTGAMYRVIGLLAAEQKIDIADTESLVALCDRTTFTFPEVDGSPRVMTDARDVTSEIRTPEVAQHASRYSTVPAVRERLVDCQRRLGADGGVVMEGRDIGTVVFPQAGLKVFLDASPEERARRRANELGMTNAADILRMTNEIAERDERDRTRAHSPMVAASDAVLVDSTETPIDAVVERLQSLAKARLAGLATDI